MQKKSIFRLEPYTNKKGKKGLGIRLDMRDLAAYPEPDPRIGNQLFNDYKIGDKRFRVYFDHSLARKAIEDWEVPKDLLGESRLMAGRIGHLFADVTKIVIERNCISGRLDTRKLSNVVMTSLSGTYTAETVRPYKHRELKPARPPRIAILSSAGDGEVGNPKYLPTLMRTSLALQWAAEANGLDVYATMSLGRHRVHPKSGYEEAVMPYMLAEPGSTYSPKIFRAALDYHLWWQGMMNLMQHEYAYAEQLSMLDDGQTSFGKSNVPYLFVCGNGGPAVAWAREWLKPDLIITVGNISDRQDADIQLEITTTPDTIVKDIARQINKLSHTA